MTREFKISLFCFIFSVILSYDLLKAGVTYLHLVHFDETLHIGPLRNLDNLVDLLIKFTYLNSILAAVNIFIIGVYRLITNSNALAQQSGIVKILNCTLHNHIVFYTIFVGLFVTWVSLRYQNDKYIHRAILWMLVFLISRFALLVGSILGHIMDFMYLRYPGQIMGMVLNLLLVGQILGVPITNTLLT